MQAARAERSRTADETPRPGRPRPHAAAGRSETANDVRHDARRDRSRDARRRRLALIRRRRLDLLQDAAAGLALAVITLCAAAGLGVVALLEAAGTAVLATTLGIERWRRRARLSGPRR